MGAKASVWASRLAGGLAALFELVRSINTTRDAGATDTQLQRAVDILSGCDVFYRAILGEREPSETAQGSALPGADAG